MLYDDKWPEPLSLELGTPTDLSALILQIHKVSHLESPTGGLQIIPFLLVALSVSETASGQFVDLREVLLQFQRVSRMVRESDQTPPQTSVDQLAPSPQNPSSSSFE